MNVRVAILWEILLSLLGRRKPHDTPEMQNPAGASFHPAFALSFQWWQTGPHSPKDIITYPAKFSLLNFCSVYIIIVKKNESRNKINSHTSHSNNISLKFFFLFSMSFLVYINSFYPCSFNLFLDPDNKLIETSSKFFQLLVTPVKVKSPGHMLK